MNVSAKLFAIFPKRVCSDKRWYSPSDGLVLQAQAAHFLIALSALFTLSTVVEVLARAFEFQISCHAT